MKQHLVRMALILLVAGLCVPAAFAQTGSVKGACKDLDGKPIAGAAVLYTSLDNGRKYSLKTDNRGEYFSLGIQLGKYTVTLTKDGQKLDEANNFTVQSGDNTLDFDLKKSQVQSAQQQGISPEQLKKLQEQHEKQAKEVNVVKALNEKLAAAADATKAKDYATAISVLTEASQIDAARDLIWFKLADAYRASADTQTDAAEKAKRLDAAISDYQKAIDIAEKAQQSGSKTTAQDVAAYYNNMGEAYARASKTDGAVAAYNHAAQLNPAGAGQYYYNLGAILTNANTSNDATLRKAAVDAFDKAITADPKRADAYYWKGTNLIGGATLQGDKMVAPPGTAEAFNSYLELQPTGSHAEEAKAMLSSIGATIETTYGKKKK
jgi:tetratricopeptide (TPR) repeat protein